MRTAAPTIKTEHTTAANTSAAASARRSEVRGSARVTPSQ
jgi:hypothetical protein